jgi:zinc-finger of the FCS-type, C2-C2
MLWCIWKKRNTDLMTHIFWLTFKNVFVLNWKLVCRNCKSLTWCCKLSKPIIWFSILTIRIKIEDNDAHMGDWTGAKGLAFFLFWGKKTSFLSILYFCRGEFAFCSKECRQQMIAKEKHRHKFERWMQTLLRSYSPLAVQVPGFEFNLHT